MQTNIFCKRDDFGQDKRGLRSWGWELAASFSVPPSSLPGCFLARLFSGPGLSLSPRPSPAEGRLLARHPPPCSGQRVPQASGLPGARSGGGDPVQQPRAVSFPRPAGSPPRSPRPGTGSRPGLCRAAASRPGLCRAAASQPVRSRGTARLVHQCFGTPAKTRASELSILIEIAGLDAAGGCLYRFDFCCSGKHITND